MSLVRICMCDHLRIVVLTAEGWTHVSPTGMLEVGTQPCQAGVYRFDVERPRDSHAAVNAVMEDLRTLADLSKIT